MRRTFRSKDSDLSRVHGRIPKTIVLMSLGRSGEASHLTRRQKFAISGPLSLILALIALLQMNGWVPLAPTAPQPTVTVSPALVPYWGNLKQPGDVVWVESRYLWDGGGGSVGSY